MEEGFVEVAAASDVPAGGSLSVKVGRRQIALFESAGQYFALEDQCPHQGVPLSEGEVEGGCVRCWYHGWEFDLRTGHCYTYSDFPATAFEVREEDGRLWVKLPPPTIE